MLAFTMRAWLPIAIVSVCFYVLIPAPSQAGHIFLLTYKDHQFSVERAEIPAGQAMVMQSNPEDGIIDVILPVGPGGSGSVARLGDGRSLIVSCQGDSITYRVRQSSGKESVFPTRALPELEKYDTRLSVSNGSGNAANFVIEGYERVVIDSVGPTIDLFAGMIPLAPGDFVLYTDTHRKRFRPQVTGTFSIRYERYIYVDVSGPGGHDGLFILDIGAANSIVEKSFVSPDQEIAESHMMEYSSAGARKLKYEPVGGTGAVTNIVGSTTLDYMRIGEITFRNVEVDVIEELPRIGGQRVDGIIGIDVLASAPFLTLKYNRSAESGPSVNLSTSRVAEEEAIELPYTTVNGLLYVNASTNNTVVHFLLDSGAPNSFLSPEALELTNTNSIFDSSFAYSGGGGQVAQGKMGLLDELTVGDEVFSDHLFAVGEIQPLKRIRRGEAAGLLGNSFFEMFSLTEIDFDQRVVRFVK